MARRAPAEAVGNRRAGPRATPVEDLIAEGPGTIAPAPATTSRGRGVRTPNGWAVVIVRAMPHGLSPTSRTRVAFAVWEGSAQEAGRARCAARGSGSPCGSHHGRAGNVARREDPGAAEGGGRVATPRALVRMPLVRVGRGHSPAGRRNRRRRPVRGRGGSRHNRHRRAIPFRLRSGRSRAAARSQLPRDARAGLAHERVGRTTTPSVTRRSAATRRITSRSRWVVAYLTLKEAYALATGDAERAALAADAGARFRTEHLANVAAPLAALLANSHLEYLALASRVLASRVGPAPRSARLPMAPTAEREDDSFECGT